MERIGSLLSTSSATWSSPRTPRHDSASKDQRRRGWSRPQLRCGPGRLTGPLRHPAGHPHPRPARRLPRERVGRTRPRPEASHRHHRTGPARGEPVPNDLPRRGFDRCGAAHVGPRGFGPEPVWVVAGRDEEPCGDVVAQSEDVQPPAHPGLRAPSGGRDPLDDASGEEPEDPDAVAAELAEDLKATFRKRCQCSSTARPSPMPAIGCRPLPRWSSAYPVRVHADGVRRECVLLERACRVERDPRISDRGRAWWGSYS
jgi:hypothetical protein